MQDWLEAMQWPAMAATVLATWLVGSRSDARRRAGFWVFLLSNILWIAWGWQGDAYALILLQVALVAMNVRGMRKADKAWHDTARAGARRPG
ncbi:hypothetical protein LMG31506_03483 [Cupriavidus yeoncheonensis]|uniref:Amino acid transporter n=1 Tax=Cupriavidus yeoncheonensis TaxID=1462994 RepID=A0A916MYK0_9BURK|nr:hypothetical protein [Cupriavidus yeoncheonensis]CAG2146844.1 hypothetical protein LMG31506_03483 [Cupriavidus yeoncheonensis]